ncbi:hypothetical protein EYF80_052373 [Liparis tanakae]|uniref:Uncharacterized protein n=1 Tax=Liparis tanakae TaxID=230148 RepID=A0A4Z2F8H9_9TELE|nr:hypothetical protein EYF80_052373 [Liparis tanakae]
MEGANGKALRSPPRRSQLNPHRAAEPRQTLAAPGAPNPSVVFELQVPVFAGSGSAFEEQRAAVKLPENNRGFSALLKGTLTGS